LDVDLHFARQTEGKGRLTQAGGAVEQDVSERILAFGCRVDRDLQSFEHGPLADHFVHPLGSQIPIAVVSRGRWTTQQRFAWHDNTRPLPFA
jgi:hypothetical protein